MNLLTVILLAAVPVEVCPTPQAVDGPGRQVFRLVRGTPIVVADDATAAELAVFDALFDAIGFTLPIRRAAEHARRGPAVYVGEPGRHSALGQRKRGQFASKKGVPPPQGYRLTIDNKAVVVAGGDPAGTFYGVQTLVQMAKAGIELPAIEIRDYPDLAWRGVYLESAPTAEDLARLAALKGNLAVVASDDFYRLADAATPWQRVFDDARAHHIEPVPLIRTLAKAAPLVAMNPAIAEGRLATEHLVLEGDAWKTLARGNAIVTETSPIRVQVSGHRCEAQVDYTLEPGALAFPFDRDAARWRIRRMPGGAIPDGATVTVTYTYVPPGTAACCPSAPETRALLREVMGDLVRTLGPRFIHIDHGDVERLNQCLRCRGKNRTNAAAFARSVTLIDEIAKELDPAIRLMLWADAINPHQQAARNDLAAAAALLPNDVILVLRHATGDHALIDASVAWCRRLGVTYMGAPSGGPAGASAWCQALGEGGQGATGLIYAGAAGSTEALTVAMDKAWSVATPRSPWAEGMNAHFGADLWRPEFPEVMDAVTAYVNRQTLAGVLPAERYAAFKDGLNDLRKRVRNEETDIRLADWVYRNVVTYLELETAFAEARQTSVLRDLVELVEAQAEIDPALDTSRVARIVETVETKGLFVPSTILFGRHLLPYRAMDVPAGHVALEAVVAPAYTDAEHEAAATFDFLAPPGPICRIDFETVGTATLEVESSLDGRDFRPAQQWTSDLRGGVAGPAILAQPFRAPFLRVTAHAPAERAVLRNPRVFAFKGPARVTCSFVRVVPRPDDPYFQIAWPDGGQADGFVRVGEAVFAEAPTTVQVCRTREALLVGALVHEPRMRTLAATQTQRDAPLGQEEAFEILLHTGQGAPFRFAVNPVGAQADWRGDDVGWDGPWRVRTERHAAAWSLVVTIPFDTLGATPKRGASWRVNFIRNRVNVHSERSAWTPSGDPYDLSNYGTPTFFK